MLTQRRSRSLLYFRWWIKYLACSSNDCRLATPHVITAVRYQDGLKALIANEQCLAASSTIKLTWTNHAYMAAQPQTPNS